VTRVPNMRRARRESNEPITEIDEANHMTTQPILLAILKEWGK
jgi:hypothetical protein